MSKNQTQDFRSKDNAKEITTREAELNSGEFVESKILYKKQGIQGLDNLFLEAIKDNKDLSIANLNGLDLSHKKAKIHNVSLFESEIINANFTQTEFVGVDFSNADCSGSNFTLATFKNCDFTNAVMVNTVWEKVKFEDCIFDGADLSDVDLDKPPWKCKNITERPNLFYIRDNPTYIELHRLPIKVSDSLGIFADKENRLAVDFEGKIVYGIIDPKSITVDDFAFKGNKDKIQISKIKIINIISDFGNMTDEEIQEEISASHDTKYIIQSQFFEGSNVSVVSHKGEGISIQDLSGIEQTQKLQDDIRMAQYAQTL